MKVTERTKQILSMLTQIDKQKKLSKRECNIISKLVAILMESPGNVREEFYQSVLVLIGDVAKKIKNNMSHENEMEKLEETISKDKIYN
jgi:CheY-specific phosphatase CheX